MGEGDAASRIDPAAFVVRAPMPQTGSHARYRFAQISRRSAAPKFHHAGEAAHQGHLVPAAGARTDGFAADAGGQALAAGVLWKHSSSTRNGIAITRSRASRPKFVIAAEKIIENCATNKIAARITAVSREARRASSNSRRRFHTRKAKIGRASCRERAKISEEA